MNMQLLKYFLCMPNVYKFYLLTMIEYISFCDSCKLFEIHRISLHSSNSQIFENAYIFGAKANVEAKTDATAETRAEAEG